VRASQWAHFCVLECATKSFKLLFWDGSGLWVCAKRLEKGRFRGPKTEGEKVLLNQAELALLLGGIDLLQTQRRRWHQIAAAVEKKTA
jgi:transposase